MAIHFVKGSIMVRITALPANRKKQRRQSTLPQCGENFLEGKGKGACDLDIRRCLSMASVLVTCPFRSRTDCPDTFVQISMLRVNPYEQHVAARLLDFCDLRTPWHRLLWNPGLPLVLKEISEASEARQVGVLSSEAVRMLCSAAMTLAGLDPGVGSKEQRRFVQDTLRSEIRYTLFAITAGSMVSQTPMRDSC